LPLYYNIQYSALNKQLSEVAEGCCCCCC